MRHFLSLRRLSYLVLIIGYVILVATLHSAFSQSTQSIRRVAFLTSMAPWDAEQGFIDGLRERGYVEGKNIQIDWYRSATGDPGLPNLAAEIVRKKVDIIVTFRTPPARAALGATKDIPVVFVAVADAVRSGLVPNLAHPEGNGTGISLLSSELTTKRLDLLHQLSPRIRRVAYITNLNNAVTTPQVIDLQNAAKELGIQIEVFDTKSGSQTDVNAVLKKIPWKKFDGVQIGGDAIHMSSGSNLAHVIHSARLPAIFPWEDYHDHNEVLMTYGGNIRKVFNRGAYFVDRILKGTPPSQLPVEQISNIDLVLNLRLAKSMKINVPAALLYRADRTIQ